MATATEAQLSHVVSRDGTEIAYYSSGHGPPLLLVHGGGGDHTRWDVLRPHLEAHHAVHALDRRGHGASGDQPDYRLEREFEDVAAVIGDIAARAGGPVDVYGHSYGGMCAFGAAPLTGELGRLALYEGWWPVHPEAFPPPAGFIPRVEALLDAGDRETALDLIFREVVGFTDEEMSTYRAQPSWAARVAAVHNYPREERAFAQRRFDPDHAAQITVPALLLTGTESPDWKGEVDTVAAALPDVRVAVLQGQAHGADIVAPELVADRLLAFLGDQR